MFEKAQEEHGEYGVVEQVRHSIAIVRGLPGARLNELVYFDNDEPGRVIVLDHETIQITQMSSVIIKPGQKVARSGRPIFMQVGAAQRGQLVNPLGQSVIPGISISGSLEEFPIDKSTPPLEHRAPINKPLMTGTSIVDLLVPIALGQREAVFGDQKTGKSTFLISTAKAHAEAGGIVVYCLIGRPTNDLKRIHDFIMNDDLIRQNIIVVATTSNDAPSLIEITPFSAMTAAEYWRDQGNDVLLILQDLSSHARFHRETSLVAGKFPGRESYPGDIFHEHAKLLERAGNFKVSGKGEGSITCLPVVETVEGDLGSYIVSNIISITDGHLMFNASDYNKGQRPAVDPEGSVTRIGLKVRQRAVKEFQRELMAYLAKYEQAEKFSHFGNELSEKLKIIRKTGDRLRAFFAQGIYQNIPASVQIIMATMIWLGWLNDKTLDQVIDARDRFSSKYRADQKIANKIDDILKTENLKECQKEIEFKKEWLLEICQQDQIKNSK